MTSSSDPGVPEALPRTLRFLEERLPPRHLDRLWIFPSRIRGRKEWGLVVASVFRTDEDGDRRRLFTARYIAEQTGKGLSVEPALIEEGIAPEDRFPRLIEGVVRRSEEELGSPRVVEVRGEPERFEELMEEFDPSLLEEESDED